MGKSLRQVVSSADLQRILEPPTHRIKYSAEYDSTGDGMPGDKVKALYANIVTPSYAHGYSLGIEYMTNWFERGFDKDFFKSIYIDGKHVIDDYKKFSKMMIKGENPRARIAPTVDYDYDRDGLDFYMGAPNTYIRRSRWQDAFFKDYERNLFLGFVPRAMRMNFNFKVRVNSRSQQLDVFNKMEINFRVGATQAEYISVDFHVPKGIMLNIAYKAGFKVQNGEVLEIVPFLHYLNAHSQVPFLFKLRAINQQPEFFIRIDELYAHIMNKDKLSLDDGERDGKLDFNFHVEMNSVLDMPIPYFYAFYSAEEFMTDLEVNALDMNAKPLYSINLIDIDKVDEHGWNQNCYTTYMCEEGDTEIDISELFAGNNVLNRAITHDLTLGVSPIHFMNIKMFRDRDISRKVEFTMDWDKKVIKLKHPESEGVLHIVIYLDEAYINELEINLQDYNKSRVSPSELGQTANTFTNLNNKKKNVYKKHS